MEYLRFPHKNQVNLKLIVIYDDKQDSPLSSPKEPKQLIVNAAFLLSRK